MREHRVQDHPPTVETRPDVIVPVEEPQERSALERGQAMVEYVLIIVLLALGFGFALAITGPAIGNVFNNVLYQFVGQDPSLPIDQISDPGEGGSPNEFWATVTWVAQYRQTETPFPTPVTRPTLSGVGGGGSTMTPSQTYTATPSLTPSNTPTFTQTLTPSLTPTFTYTPSPGPSPTPPDRVFDVPHVDQMGNPLWWRLNRSTLIEELSTQVWDVTYYDNIANYTSATAFTYSPPSPTPTTHLESSWTNGGVAQYWGSWRPDGLTNSNTWAAVYTKTVTFITPVSFTTSLHTASTDAARLTISTLGVVNSVYNTTSWTTSSAIYLPAGTYTFTLEYADSSSDAQIELTFGSLMRYNNPDDNYRACLWDVVQDTDSSPDNNTTSSTWMFAQDPNSLTNSGTGYASGQTCYLEMRGYVDLSSTTQPILSFWDYWSLPSGITAQLQVSRYVEVSAGAVPPELNRGGLSWTTIALRTGGTTNYNWTRNQLDLSSYQATMGDKMTFRFVLTNTGSATSGTHRWFIDDLQVLDDTTPTNAEHFTINDTWDMDDRTQMDDFIFDGETMRTLETTGGVPNQINGSTEWRWDLTSTRPNGGSGMSWDDSPGFNHVNRMHSSATSPRVAFLEFKYPIDLRSSVAPPTDFDGNSGRALLRFFTTYSVGWNTDIQLEYTTIPPGTTINSPGSMTNPRNWQIVPNDGRIRRAAGCTTCDANEQSAADITGTGYRQIDVRLDQVPGYSTTPFYLRFALYARDGNAEGWYIDDISFRRDSGSMFLGYPFNDDAEDPGLTSSVWDFVSGNWQATTEEGSVANVGMYAYHDSVGGNYPANSDKWMEITPLIDLNYDTDLNVDNPGSLGEPLRASGAASNPMLSFYHQRRTESGDRFTVDIYVESTATWYTIWQYVDDSSRGSSLWSRIQDTWERVEIDLAAGIASSLGTPYSTIISNGVENDDDIRIRFRMVANSSNQSNGVYVDNIFIGDRVEYVHKLWGTTPFGGSVSGAGDGEYEDFIEFASRTINTSTEWNPLTAPVSERWHLSGGWQPTNDGADYVHSGGLALTESSPPGTQYDYNTEHFLEMRPVIDLRGTDPSLRPMLSFWARYDIGDDDRLRVQISTESVGDLTQSHDDMAGWSRWEPSRTAYSTAYMFNSAPRVYWHRVDDTGTQNGTPERRDTWQFYQVDLASFVGSRIRIRFFLDSDHSTSLTPPLGDGWYIDDVSVRFGQPDFGPGTSWSAWTDNGSEPDNWIMEGSWGVTDQYQFFSSTEAFGTGEWRGFIFDCEQIVANNTTMVALGYNANQCDDNNQNLYDDLFDNVSNPTTNSPPFATGVVGPFTPAEIDYLDGNYGTADSGLTPTSDFFDTYFARFERDVTLNPGVYTFSAYSDDGIRLITDDNSNMLINGSPMVDNYIIEDWSFHGVQRTDAVLEVQATVNVTLTLEFYDGCCTDRFVLGASLDDFSYTDSPNTPNAVNSYDVVNSIRYGNSSLMLDGYFDLSTAPQRFLTYHRLWDLVRYQNVYVDVSTDGGFTWTNVDSVSQDAIANPDGNEAITPGSGGSTNLPPSRSWVKRYVQLPTGSNVMFRFRLDTIRGDATDDGVWIDQIELVR